MTGEEWDVVSRSLIDCTVTTSTTTAIAFPTKAVWVPSLLYFVTVVVLSSVHIGSVRLIRRHRARTSQDGLYWIPEFSSKSSACVWFTSQLSMMFQFGAVLVPVFIFVVNAILALPLCFFEGWSWRSGWYTVMYFLGVLPYQIPGDTPVTLGGTIAAVIIASSVFTLGNTVLGMASLFRFVGVASDHMPTGFFGLFLLIFIIFPSICNLLSVIVGTLIAFAEGWEYETACLCTVDLFATGGAIGFCPSPPKTSGGIFIVMIGNILLMTIAGTIVGTAGSHEALVRLINMIEGVPADGVVLSAARAGFDARMNSRIHPKTAEGETRLEDALTDKQNACLPVNGAGCSLCRPLPAADGATPVKYGMAQQGAVAEVDAARLQDANAQLQSQLQVVTTQARDAESRAKLAEGRLQQMDAKSADAENRVEAAAAQARDAERQAQLSEANAQKVQMAWQCLKNELEDRSRPVRGLHPNDVQVEEQEERHVALRMQSKEEEVLDLDTSFGKVVEREQVQHAELKQMRDEMARKTRDAEDRYLEQHDILTMQVSLRKSAEEKAVVAEQRLDELRFAYDSLIRTHLELQEKTPQHNAKGLASVCSPQSFSSRSPSSPRMNSPRSQSQRPSRLCF